ncbi:MAG: tRNA (adenosine(37)-N6)-threonylcarbamoyltransferase complex ATPase subunit type 1 TsaE [Rubrivivax sp.]
MRPMPHGIQHLIRRRLMTTEPPSILETQYRHWPDEAACQRHAEALAARPAVRNSFIVLRGELGAGKTTWVRHLLRALGVQGRIKSPTYALAEPYQVGGLAIHHFDFYRFNDPREWLDAGLRDIFEQPGLKLVEWAERAEGGLPTPDLRITLDTSEGDSPEGPSGDAVDNATRHVRLDALTPRGRELLT